jgi:endonuclease/exonuclease/phosphatase family metal-dependent hydrolase
VPKAFPKPRFSFHFRVPEEVRRLRSWRDSEPNRQVPHRSSQRLLVGSWNIANLGGQDRTASHYRLLAEIVSWFDVCAIQEVKDDLSGLRGLLTALNELRGSWRTIFTDRAGNDERLAFVYDSKILEPAEKIGELAIPAAEKRAIRLPTIDRAFDDFDRHPHIVTFRRPGSCNVIELLNVHLYFGPQGTAAQRRASSERRQLEAFAVGRWCDLRHRDVHTYTQLIAALGDFNLPKRDPADEIYQALTKRGLTLPDHSTRIASSISTDVDYDQVAFLPGPMGDRFARGGVFDYDGAVFPRLWETRGRRDFLAYCRYYMSDHRPIWAQFRW